MPSSPNSSPGGRSSVTPNSPLPRRVRPLRITWIGRSSSCASSAGHEHRDEQRDGAAVSSAGCSDVGQLLPHQQRGHADADRAERPRRRAIIGCRTSSVCAVARVDHAQLLERAGRRRASPDRRAAAAAGRPALGSLAGDDDAVGVEDGGAGDALAVDARLENRAQARVARAAPRTGRRLPATTSRARWKIVHRQQLAARCLALVQDDARRAAPRTARSAPPRRRRRWR